MKVPRRPLRRRLERLRQQLRRAASAVLDRVCACRSSSAWRDVARLRVPRATAPDEVGSSSRRAGRSSGLVARARLVCAQAERDDPGAHRGARSRMAASGALRPGGLRPPPFRPPPPLRPRNARASARAATAISHGASQTPFTASRHQADAPIASRLTAGARASRTVHHDRRQRQQQVRDEQEPERRHRVPPEQDARQDRLQRRARRGRARRRASPATARAAGSPRRGRGATASRHDAAEGGEPVRLLGGAARHALERAHDAEDAAPHPLERRRVELVRRVGRLVVVGVEGGEGRVGGEEGRVARLQEGQVVAVEPHAERRSPPAGRATTGRGRRPRAGTPASREPSSAARTSHAGAITARPFSRGSA